MLHFPSRRWRIEALDSMRRGHWDWVLIGAIAAFDAVLAWYTGIPITTARADLEFVLGCLVVVPLMFIVIGITGLARDGMFMSDLPAKVFASLKTLVPLSYFAAMAPTPLIDEPLRAVDAAVGFDWTGYYRFVMSHPIVSDLFGFCYGHFMQEGAILLLALALFAQDAARRFVTAMIVSLLISIAIFAVFPAAGPFVTAGIADVPTWGNFTEHFLAARGHTIREISEMRGLISFPSYHACSAVLLTYFARSIRPVFFVAMPFNAIILAATPVFGGHYLVDVVAGIGVAFCTIALLTVTAPVRVVDLRATALQF